MTALALAIILAAAACASSSNPELEVSQANQESGAATSEPIPAATSLVDAPIEPTSTPATEENTSDTVASDPPSEFAIESDVNGFLEFSEQMNLAACFSEVMTVSPQAAIGLGALNSKATVPSEAQPETVSALATCVVPSEAAEFFRASIGGLPGFDEALDNECLDTTLADDETGLRSVWQVVVETSGQADGGYEIDGAGQIALGALFFRCVSLGKLTASSAGLDLTDDETACLDEQFALIPVGDLLTGSNGADLSRSQAFATCGIEDPFS